MPSPSKRARTRQPGAANADAGVKGQSATAESRAPCAEQARAGNAVFSSSASSCPSAHTRAFVCPNEGGHSGATSGGLCGQNTHARHAANAACGVPANGPPLVQSPPRAVSAPAPAAARGVPHNRVFSASPCGVYFCERDACRARQGEDDLVQAASAECVSPPLCSRAPKCTGETSGSRVANAARAASSCNKNMASHPYSTSPLGNGARASFIYDLEIEGFDDKTGRAWGGREKWAFSEKNGDRVVAVRLVAWQPHASRGFTGFPPSGGALFPAGRARGTKLPEDAVAGGD